MPDQYRLIWFQHFHKAGGTSITDLAMENDECFWPNHGNGNPRNENGFELKLWEYSKNELKQFVDSCQEQAVTFVATEWGLPDIDYLYSDSRVTLITCIRDPIERYISNFYYDLYNGYTLARSLYEYESSRERTITMFNYYCRVLSNHQNHLSKVMSGDFDIARSTLEKFDICIFLEDGFTKLGDALSWKMDSLHSNQMSSDLKTLLSLVRRGEFQLAYFRLRYPRKKPTNEFSRHFISENTWDLKLYVQALEVHKAK